MSNKKDMFEPEPKVKEPTPSFISKLLKQHRDELSFDRDKRIGLKDMDNWMAKRNPYTHMLNALFGEGSFNPIPVQFEDGKFVGPEWLKEHHHNYLLNLNELLEDLKAIIKALYDFINTDEPYYKELKLGINKVILDTSDVNYPLRIVFNDTPILMEVASESGTKWELLEQTVSMDTKTTLIKVFKNIFHELNIVNYYPTIDGDSIIISTFK